MPAKTGISFFMRLDAVPKKHLLPKTVLTHQAFFMVRYACIFGISLASLFVLPGGNAAASEAQQPLAQPEKGNVYKVTTDDGLGGVKTVYRTVKKRKRNPNALAELKASNKIGNSTGDAQDAARPVNAEKKAAAPDDDTLSEDENLSEDDIIKKVMPGAMPKKQSDTNRFFHDAENGLDAEGKAIPNSVVQRLTRRNNEFLETEYRKNNWDNSEMNKNFKEPGAFSTIAPNEWSEKFSLFNRSQSESVEMKQILTDSQRESFRLEQKDYEFNHEKISTWSRNLAEGKNRNADITRDLHEKFLSNKIVSMNDRLSSRHKGVHNFSMQDINRYQYRRNGSTEGGFHKGTVGTGNALDTK